jgi:hypothetical protein
MMKLKLEVYPSHVVGTEFIWRVKSEDAPGGTGSFLAIGRAPSRDVALKRGEAVMVAVQELWFEGDRVYGS